MKKQDVFVTVPIEDYQFTDGQMSFPTINDGGLVHQAWQFDIKHLDKSRYKALKPLPNVYVLTEEELKELYADAWQMCREYEDAPGARPDRETSFNQIITPKQ
jgi:hypothetical protein